jgi:hypothetical protein
MSFTTRADAHAELMRRMAGTLGLDLTEAVLAGELAAPDLRGLVLNCMACREAGACTEFLDSHAETGADAAPGYCRNRATLDRLAAQR